LVRDHDEQHPPGHPLTATISGGARSTTAGTLTGDVADERLAPALATFAREYQRLTGYPVTGLTVTVTDDHGQERSYRFPPGVKE